MTDPKGNVEFCFSQTLNIEDLGETKLTVSWGQSLSVLLYLSTKKKNKLQKHYLLDAGCHTNLLWFQGAQPDIYACVENSSYSFARELVSFVCPREFGSFDV